MRSGLKRGPLFLTYIPASGRRVVCARNTHGYHPLEVLGETRKNGGAAWEGSKERQPAIRLGGLLRNQERRISWFASISQVVGRREAGKVNHTSECGGRNQQRVPVQNRS
jgi:hypothetical protein